MLAFTGIFRGSYDFDWNFGSILELSVDVYKRKDLARIRHSWIKRSNFMYIFHNPMASLHFNAGGHSRSLNFDSL